MKYFIALVIPLGIFFSIVGCMEIASQHSRITGFTSVRATIVSVELRRAGSKTYKPIVRYKYEVEGQVFSCDKVFPLPDDGAKSWARGVIAQFPVGDEVDGWYDPERPREAFLIRRYSFFPYGMLLIGMFCCAIGPPIVLQLHRDQKGPPEPDRLPDGWYQLRAPGTLTGATRQFGYVAAAWFTVGGAVVFHFFRVAEAPYDRMSIVGSIVWALAGAALIGLAVYPYWLGRRMGDAVFLIDQARARTGHDLHVRVEQLIHRASTVRMVSVELRCTRSERQWISLIPVEYGKTAHSYRHTALEDYDAHAGETIAADFEIIVPPDAPPSTPPTSRSKDRYAWKLHLSTRLYGVPPCPDAFGITVEQGVPDDEPLAEAILLEESEDSTVGTTEEPSGEMEDTEA